MSPEKTAEPIEMPFGLWARVGPRSQVLEGGAHWRNLANTEPSMLGGAPAFFVKLVRSLVNILANDSADNFTIVTWSSEASHQSRDEHVTIVNATVYHLKPRFHVLNYF